MTEVAFLCQNTGHVRNPNKLLKDWSRKILSRINFLE